MIKLLEILFCVCVVLLIHLSITIQP